MTAAHATRRRQSDPATVDDGRRQRVLVVEHDRVLRKMLADSLAESGYKVTCASHGLEGWCAFELERPHAVVVDLDMPYISGFRLLRLLRTETDPALAHIPVIVVTGCDMQEARDVAVATRRDVYVKKPFVVEELVARLDALVNRRAA